MLNKHFILILPAKHDPNDLSACSPNGRDSINNQYPSEAIIVRPGFVFMQLPIRNVNDKTTRLDPIFNNINISIV